MSKKLCITILAWNNQKDLSACLESTFSQDFKDLDYQVWVLDNNSNDNTWEYLQSLVNQPKYQNRLVIKHSPINTGFAGGHNLLIKEAVNFGFEQFLLLNQDAEFVNNDDVYKLSNRLSGYDDLAIIQPMYKNTNGSIASSGILVNYTGAATPTARFYNTWKNQNPKPDLIPVSIAQFGVVIIGTKVFQKIGYLEDLYHAYHEDVEYSLRASINDIPRYTDPSVIIMHDQKPGRFRTKKYSQYLMERNRITMILAYYPKTLLLLCLPGLLLQEIAMGGFMFLAGNLDGKFKGWQDIVTNRKKILEHRKQCRNRIKSKQAKQKFFANFVSTIDATNAYNDPGISNLVKIVLKVQMLFTKICFIPFWLYRELFIKNSVG